MIDEPAWVETRAGSPLIVIDMHYTRTKLRKLHAEFHSLPGYEDRVSYFDQHFLIIPHTFPNFQTDLRLFFSDEHFYRLYDILNFERNNKPFVRTFTDEERFSFSINPLQHQVIIINKYISAKFTLDEETLIRQTESSNEEQLRLANEMINYAENKIRQGRGLDFRTQFMNLFMKGVQDAVLKEQSLMIYKKRKVIELYLYATGLSYGRYWQELKKRTQESVPTINNYKDPNPVDAVKKVLLLEELGCIDAIRKKHASLSEAEMHKKIAEVLSLITGDNWLKFTGFIANILMNKRE